MNRAAFLDRDGVINQKPRGNGYVTRREELHFLPGVTEAIALLKRAGFQVFVVSNQRCIAKGLLSIEDLEAIHRHMVEELAAAGAVVDGVFYCPHEEKPPCSCRKPAPGMLLAAAAAHHIDLPASWMIGDAEIDVLAGKRAGCKTARLLQAHEIARNRADVSAVSLLEATRQILAMDVMPPAQERSKTVMAINGLRGCCQ